MSGLMSGVSLFAGMAGSIYGSLRGGGGGVSIAGFQLVAAVKESSSLSFNKTKYPVESGGNVSDHISEQQPTLKIEGVVSAMTLGVVSGLSSIMSNGIGLESLRSGMVGGKHLMTNAKHALETIARKKAAITVTSGIEVYENYTIDEISFDRDNSAEKLSISISLSRIDKAEAVWAEITRQSTVKQVAKKGGVTKKSGGAASVSKVAETKTDDSDDVSFLKAAKDGGVKSAGAKIANTGRKAMQAIYGG